MCFNHYMEQVCEDRAANGKSFDTKLLQYWKDTYGKRKRLDWKQEATALETAKQRRVKTHSDGDIQQVVGRKLERQALQKVSDEWDDNDEIVGPEGIEMDLV